jgi:hypothetical protein
MRPAADVRLIAWCRACGHQVEASSAEGHGADTPPVLNFARAVGQLSVGGRNIDIVVSATSRS